MDSALLTMRSSVEYFYTLGDKCLTTLRQAPQKEGGEILCDSGWCVHKSDV